MTRALHIIASCTDRKRLPVPDELRLRGVPTGSASDRAGRWWQRLSRHRSATLRASDLYVGDHWAIIKALPDVARAAGFRSFLWVASAGYGLVPGNALLRSYSATFAPGHPDSVAASKNGTAGSRLTRQWWTRLADMPSPLEGVPRTVADIVGDNPHAYVLLVASPNYISAMEDDLFAAIQASRESDRFIIVSARGRFAAGPLGAHLIPSEARLQIRLGGARPSLHARVARKILEECRTWELSAERLARRYQRILARSPDLPRFDRERMTDEEVERFIRAEARRSPEVSCTRLLRALRDRGCACEQSRFKALFCQVRKTTHAS